MTRELNKNQVRRLPLYLNYLLSKEKEGVEFISMQTMSSDLKINVELLKKDMQHVSTSSGIPNKGREVTPLIKDIKRILGSKENHNAILVGCGSLGKAILNYEGFKDYNLKIVGAFDKNKEIIGTYINNIRIYDIDDLKEVKRNLNASIGIICVPSTEAQGTAIRMVASGIEAIWNFAPIELDVNDDVIVSNMNMATSLASLAHRLYIKKNYKGEKEWEEN